MNLQSETSIRGKTQLMSFRRLANMLMLPAAFGSRYVHVIAAARRPLCSVHGGEEERLFIMNLLFLPSHLVFSSSSLMFDDKRRHINEDTDRRAYESPRTAEGCGRSVKRFRRGVNIQSFSSYMIKLNVGASQQWCCLRGRSQVRVCSPWRTLHHVLHFQLFII